MAPTPDGAVASAEPVLVHSSWRGIVSAYLSTVALAALAAVAFTGGAVVIGSVLGAIALVVGLIAFLDYPIATAFGPAGAQRRCLLRRHTLAWSRIQGLTRTSDAVTTRLGEQKGHRVSRKPGGLTAVVGRRRYLLVNQCESRDECALLRDRLAEWAPDTRWFAGLPDEDTPPTWIYRHRRHRPDNG